MVINIFNFILKKNYSNTYDLSTINPIEILNSTNYSYTNYHFIVPIFNIRSFGGFSLDNPSHPLVKTLYEYKINNNLIYFDSYLNIYNQLNPIDANQALNLSISEENQYKNLDPRTASYPWEEFNPIAKMKTWHNTLKNEHKLIEGIDYIDEKSGYELRLQKEFNRLKNVFLSINRNGYIERYNDIISAELLINHNNDWIFLIRNGEHRVAALKSNGYNFIKLNLHISNIIRLSEVDFWPHVKSNIISKNSAIKIFNGIFNGDSPTKVNVVGWP
jgi:hypothetical protein